MGWGDVRYCFAMAILVILIILPHIFVRSISRRCLDQTLWNLVGISYSLWSCAVKGWFFQNGCRHEVWWKINFFFKSPLFLFPWQLRQSLSNRLRFFWLISFN
jgi:hypothetical protein